MPFLLTVRLAADDGHPTPLRQARVTAYALKQPVVLTSDGTQLVHQPESALTDDTGHATLTLYRSSEVLTPSDWAVTIDGVIWSGPVPETPGTAASILEMVESYGWGIIAAPKSPPVVAITGPAGADGTKGNDGAAGPAGPGVPLSLVTVTDDYTALTTDQTILVGASGKTITLPNASAVPAGYAFDIKNTTAGDTTTVEPTQLAPPATPVPTSPHSGGTVADGVYTVVVTYVNALGETLPSASAVVTAAGTIADTSTLVIPSPIAETGATGWNAYVSQAGSGTTKLQNVSPTAIATDLTITTPPDNATAVPPANSTASICAIDGAATYTGLAAAKAAVRCVSDGTDYWIL